MSDNREAFQLWYAAEHGFCEDTFDRRESGDYRYYHVRAYFELWQHQQSRIDALTVELEKAKRALDRAGYTLVEGAQEWKPPIGKSVLPMLDKIEALEQENAALRAQLGGANKMGHKTNLATNRPVFDIPECSERCTKHDVSTDNKEQSN